MASIKPKGRNFTEGPIFFSLLKFLIPMILAAMLQATYNTADNFVVGKFSGDTLALAAIASTSSLSSLVTNMLMGVAAGATIALSQAYGAKEDETVKKGVHTTMTFALLLGIFFGVISFVLSKPALVLMKTKAELLDKALLYLLIVCLGVPFRTFYNFGAAVLRSAGDSKTPLRILASSGLVNITLNLVFVIIFHMGIAGVAIATVTAHVVSALSVLILLTKRTDLFALKLSELHIDKPILGRILKFGIPTGLQASLFSFSNLFLARGLNSLDTVIISAKAVSSNVENICNTAINNFSNAMITFVGQNYGAKKPDRIKKSVVAGTIQAVVIGLFVSQLALIFADDIARLFIDANDPNAEIIVQYAVQIMWVILGFNFLCGTQQVMSGAVRGIGYSTSSMIITLTGACLLRILWVVFFFPLEPLHNPVGLYMAFPITWAITTLMQLIFFFIVFSKFKRKMKSNKRSHEPLEELSKT